MRRDCMGYALLPFLVALAWPLHAAGNESIILTPKGVSCNLGVIGIITLGIPALDGRGTHAPALSSTIQTDGKTLTAMYGAPFEKVSLTMKVIGEGQVQYSYTSLPDDLHLVMCQFNLPASSIVPGLTVSFDGRAAKPIPALPGKTNQDASLVNTNALSLTLCWPDGESLSLSSPLCWHGIQDARVWGKNFVGVCLTPHLVRAAPPDTTSTFFMTFTVKSPPATR